MPVNILMPALSPTMEEGTLAKWLKKEGDAVASGDILAEIETDKATMEFEAVDEGTLGKIVVAEGTEGVKVNDLIAVLLEDGESASDISEAPAPPSNGASAPAEPEAGKTAPEPAPKAQAAPADRAELGRRVFASPLARRIAKENGFDLGEIKGTGPKGRIVKADVEKHSPGATKPEAAPATAAAAPTEPPADAAGKDSVKAIFANRAFEEVKLDGMRKTIATRLSLAKRTIPHFYLRRDIRLDALLAFRSDLNAQLAERNVKLSVNDFIIKATALALQQVPECNAVWAEDRILRLTPSDVAVAVAIEGGLLTPVIRDAEMKTLSAISTEMKDLAARARERKLDPAEYQGGTTAISNLGMMGIDNFDAVINPPQASILAVGAGVKKPVVGADGQIEVATILSVTLSVDHRVIDGATGAVFLQAIRDNLEKPITMLA